MAKHEVKVFAKGIYNVANAEVIPKDAAQSSSNWLTKDGKNVLISGRKTIGAEGILGEIQSSWYGYTVDGTKVFYRRVATKIQYLKVDTWTDIITGLTEGEEVSFANYSSLAGAFTYINGKDGYWKIVNAFPEDFIDVYDSTKNFHGKILIDRGRTILWDRNDTTSQDKTGLYGSHIDAQNSTVYTAVTDEAIGLVGSANYTGTLAFKAGGSTRSCFGTAFIMNAETLTDNFDGTLSSSAGGTGTINYVTGEYDVTFSTITTSAVTADYQWEDSNDNGITDFTKSATRQPAEGFQFPQDEGGDAILNVEIGQDGAYYSLKSTSAYRLSLDADDANATNEVYRKDLGIPSWEASTTTLLGIAFMNTANPSNPRLTILQRNIADSIEPNTLLEHFNFSVYDYSEAVMDTYDRYIIILCKSLSGVNNDTILLCDIAIGTVDIAAYDARSVVKDGNDLYIGSSVTETTYQIFNGYDDDGLYIENEWTGRDETYNSQYLKKVKKVRIKGLIDLNQWFEVYMNFDNGGRTLIGTIRGDSSYVDYSDSHTIGANMVGTSQIGGDTGSEAYTYFAELKFKQSKFRKRSITILAKGIGYVDFNYIMDFDIRRFDNRLPKRYRQKQNVPLSGRTNITVYDWDASDMTWDGDGAWDFTLNT